MKSWNRFGNVGSRPQGRPCNDEPSVASMGLTEDVGLGSMLLGSVVASVGLTALGVSLVAALFPWPAPKFNNTMDKIELVRGLDHLALPRDGLAAEQAGMMVVELG